MATIERALAKIRKANPARIKNAGVSSFGGAQSVVDQVDRGSTRSLAEIVDKTVEFDLEKFSESGLLSPDNQRMSEEYRLIKKKIIKKATELPHGDEPEFLNLLMVTSALAGEGKTFTSVNLSLSLAAERDWEVLLVDTDCKNPQLSRLLGVDDEPGLLDVLRDSKLQVEEAILKTNIDGLSVLPIGHRDLHGPELLASSRMAGLCNHFTRIAGGKVITVFDSSPLLLTSESPILSGFVGQIVIVVRANSTPRQAVTQALEKIDDAKAAVGLVLNAADVGEDMLSYGNYHAYGSSYGKPQ